MKRYQTAAREADSELTSLLGFEGRLYVPEILEDHQLAPVNLQASYEEFILYLMEAAYIRPAFNVNETVVDIPCFFVKIDGLSEALNEQLKSFQIRFPTQLIHYNGFYMLERKPTAIQQSHFGAIQLKDVNSIECISKLEFVNLKHLSSHKRAAYLNAALMACTNYQNLQLQNPGHLAKLSTETLLACAIYADPKIVDAFQQRDYQKTPPKCWVQMQQKKIPDAFAIVRLLLLQSLGFDVIICSEKGYNIIENILTEDIYCKYRVEEKSGKHNHGLRSIIAIALMILIVGLIITKLFS